jgi:hypothetical protein
MRIGPGVATAAAARGATWGSRGREPGVQGNGKSWAGPVRRSHRLPVLRRDGKNERKSSREGLPGTRLRSQTEVRGNDERVIARRAPMRRL